MLWSIHRGYIRFYGREGSENPDRLTSKHGEVQARANQTGIEGLRDTGVGVTIVAARIVSAHQMIPGVSH